MSDNKGTDLLILKWTCPYVQHKPPEVCTLKQENARDFFNLFLLYSNDELIKEP